VTITAIASRRRDGRGATNRPSGDADDDGDASDEGDATAAWAAVQTVVPVAVQAVQPAAYQGLEPRA
jgi:hypothetical protein